MSNATVKAVNPANKERKVNAPYARWTDLRSGWQYSLLKSWQAKNAKSGARWFVHVKSDFPDMGDTYVSDLIPGLRRADDLTFDTSVWSDRESFLAWATQV